MKAGKLILTIDALDAVQFDPRLLPPGLHLVMTFASTGNSCGFTDVKPELTPLDDVNQMRRAEALAKNPETQEAKDASINDALDLAAVMRLDAPEGTSSVISPEFKARVKEVRAKSEIFTQILDLLKERVKHASGENEDLSDAKLGLYVRDQIHRLFTAWKDGLTQMAQGETKNCVMSHWSDQSKVPSGIRKRLLDANALSMLNEKRFIHEWLFPGKPSGAFLASPEEFERLPSCLSSQIAMIESALQANPEQKNVAEANLQKNITVERDFRFAFMNPAGRQTALASPTPHDARFPRASNVRNEVEAIQFTVITREKPLEIHLQEWNIEYDDRLSPSDYVRGEALQLKRKDAFSRLLPKEFLTERARAHPHLTMVIPPMGFVAIDDPMMREWSLPPLQNVVSNAQTTLSQIRTNIRHVNAWAKTSAQRKKAKKPTYISGVIHSDVTRRRLKALKLESSILMSLTQILGQIRNPKIQEEALSRFIFRLDAYATGEYLSSDESSDEDIDD